jgi:hypothetical protein
VTKVCRSGTVIEFWHGRFSPHDIVRGVERAVIILVAGEVESRAACRTLRLLWNSASLAGDLIFGGSLDFAIFRAYCAQLSAFARSLPGSPSIMPLNPLAPVTDYQSMLNRIFWFTTAAALAAVWLLRSHVPELESQLSKIDFAVQFGVDKILPVPAGYLFPALAAGLLTRVYRLHARVSDWLGIRERFEIDVIISELADQLGVDVTRISDEELVERRAAFMRTGFYAFVGSHRPQIDPQLIHQALDAWSWFWIGVESTLLFVLTGFGLIALNEYAAGLQTTTAALALAAVGLPLMRAQCQRYAIAQVREILDDASRESAVREAFQELLGVEVRIRRAA